MAIKMDVEVVQKQNLKIVLMSGTRKNKKKKKFGLKPVPIFGSYFSGSQMHLWSQHHQRRNAGYTKKRRRL